MRLHVESLDTRLTLELSDERIEAAGGVIRMGGLELDAELADGATLRIGGATALRPGWLAVHAEMP